MHLRAKIIEMQMNEVRMVKNRTTDFHFEASEAGLTCCGQAVSARSADDHLHRAEVVSSVRSLSEKENNHGI
jgi:hypothetical protein